MELAAATDNLEPRPAERDLGAAARVPTPCRPGERDRIGEANDDNPPDDVVGLRRLAREAERGNGIAHHGSQRSVHVASFAYIANEIQRRETTRAGVTRK
jgi:hypothetical protein